LPLGLKKNIEDYKNVLTEAEKTQIREKVAKVREAMSANNNDQIQGAVKDLEATTAPIFTRAYQASAEKRSGSPPPGPEDSGSSGASGASGSSAESGPGSESQGEFKDVR